MMWLILFALAVAAGIVFSLAAMMLQQRPRIHRRIFGGNRRSGQSDLLPYRRMRLLDLPLRLRLDGRDGFRVTCPLPPEREDCPHPRSPRRDGERFENAGGAPLRAERPNSGQ